MLARGPHALIGILLDRSVNEADRDDTAMWLGSFDDPESEAALVQIATDPRDNEELGDRCGESLSAAHPEWFGNR